MLLNRDRANAVMDRHGLDGLIAVFPENVYYLSDYWGTLLMMSRNYGVYAFLPRDLDRPAALIMPGAGVYHLESAPTWMPNVAPYITRVAPNRLAPRDYDPAAEKIEVAPIKTPLMPFPTRPDAPLAFRDTQLLARYERHSGSPEKSPIRALAGAIRAADLGKGRIGFDDPRVIGWLNESGLPDLTGNDALNIFKEIRMVKSASEIEILSKAGRMNEAAMEAVIAALEPGLPLSELGRVHARAMIDQGGRSEWIVANIRGLDGGTVERDELIKLDAVGSYKQYRGDVGRTAICGTPTDEMLRRSEAVTHALNVAYGAIQPGVPFKEVVELTLAACHDAGFPGFVIATPHSVGLEHTDHPTSVGSELPGHHTLAFLENMVFTLDMPYHEFGWGTTHVEDMMIVRSNGCENITSMDTSLRVKPS